MEEELLSSQSNRFILCLFCLYYMYLSYKCVFPCLQVNQELKKLLVASVGEDLQHRVERLTRLVILLTS